MVALEKMRFMDNEIDYQIVPVSLGDFTAMRRLEKTCFPVDAWPFLDMVAALTLPNIVRYKMVVDGEMIGFILGDVQRMKRTGWIASVCIHPDYRRRGLAEKLLAVCEVEMQMPRIKLTVRESNTAAITLYKRNGYILSGRWPKYYKGGEDGVVMEKLF